MFFLLIRKVHEPKLDNCYLPAPLAIAAACRDDVMAFECNRASGSHVPRGNAALGHHVGSSAEQHS